MKKFFYLLLALPLAFAACNETPEPEPVVKEPVLNVTETSLDFAAEGGEGVITYAVENAVEGTEVTATCVADWVEDLTVADKITFTVAANEGEARETTVVVAYGKLSKEVAVKQAAKGEEPKPTAPKLEAVTAEVEYSWDTTMGEVEFKLENPIEGVKVEAKSGASWISQVQVKENKILFAMEENKGEAREGKITAQYGMLEPIEFIVKQGAYVAPAPELTINESSVELAYDATEGSFTYTVKNAVEGVEAVATTDAEWISNLAAADGTVSFTTSVNDGFVREATITVTYGEASDSIVVKQDAADQDPSLDYYVYDIHTFEVKARTANVWDIIMSELHPERGQMYTRITVQVSEDNTTLIPTGEYSTEDGSILVNTSTDNGFSTWRYNSTATDITICELYVENDLEAHTSYIEGMFQVGNEVYGFSYEGAVDGFIYEKIGDEGITEWTNCYIYSQYKQNAKFDTSNLWMKAAAGITFDLYVRNSDNPVEQGIAAGTYPVDTWQTRMGVTTDSKINDVRISSGEMIIEMVGEDYKITFNFVDEIGNEYKGTYEGALPYTSYTHP